VSISAHFVGFSAWGYLHMATPQKPEPEIEITYIFEEEEPKTEAEQIIERLPDNYDLEKKEMKPPSQDRKAEQSKTESLAEFAEKEEYLDAEELEKLEEYIAYYELIREKIKKRVTRFYRNTAEEGRVDAIFALARTGALKTIALGPGSARNARLQKLAIKSVKSASPFPHFPAALSRDELTFSISIIFEKR